MAATHTRKKTTGKKARKRKKCCDKKCKRVERKNGLCIQHFNKAAYQVRQGNATWKGLAENGLARLREPNPYKLTGER